MAKNLVNKIFALLWIKSSQVDKFGCLRCLNNFIDLPDMIESFSSGVATFMVAKNGTKELSQPFEDGFGCSRCLKNHMEVPDMKGSFARGATAFLVVKIGTKELSQPFEDRFGCLKCLNYWIKVPNMIG